MKFYDVVNNRRTIRDFKDEPVDLEIIKRVLSAGVKAPSNDHMRNWDFIVITDKEVMAKIIKRIPKKISDKRLQFIMQSWKLDDECQQKMYADAIPKQYQMLYQAGCLILPFFKLQTSLLKPKTLSSLNAFASIWCCIENILLAATAEGLACSLRIPLGKEAEYIAEVTNHPTNYVMPCYLSIGYPAEEAVLNVQKEYCLDEKLHFNQW
ncbi:MAG: nitroreductase family protein [Eubacteriales bacterium]|nr:nitroreductase family protein [Eubacteriales bacterium]